MAKPKPSDIPNIVYDNLRAIHESRVWRKIDADQRDGFAVARISNHAIFAMMPDVYTTGQIDWDEHSQPAITETTLNHMFATVEFPS